MYPEIKHFAILYDMGEGPKIECLDANYAAFLREQLVKEN